MRYALLRLDYASCLLTILSTILVGRRYWQGWILAAANSAIICVIGFRTRQIGFIPANIFCLALYGYNILQWRRPAAISDSHPQAASVTLESPIRAHVPRIFSARRRRLVSNDDAAGNRDRIRPRNVPAQR